MRWHVIAAFRPVREVVGIFRYQAIEKFLHVMSRGRIGVLHDDHATTGVLNKDGHCPIAQTTLVDHRLDIVGDFVRSFAICAYF